MEIRSLSRLAILAYALATALSAQSKKTVFLITDAEGVAGVCRQDQTDPKDQEMRQLLTGEINAAVDGLYAGGAEDVIVWDGHDGSQTLSALTIHPRAKLIIGDLGVTMTLERHYAAIGFVGQHARANRKGGIMAHSYSPGRRAGSGQGGIFQLRMPDALGSVGAGADPRSRAQRHAEGR
jgi:D-amino peptidase